MEDGCKKVFILMWHNLNVDVAKEFYPFLNEYFILDSSKLTAENITDKIFELVRPDIYYNKDVHHQPDNGFVFSYTGTVPFEQIHHDKPFGNHELLESDLLQLKMIRNIFSEFEDSAFEKMVRDFEMDEDPEREILIWNRMVVIYMEYIKGKNLSYKARNEAFNSIRVTSINSLNEDNYRDYISLKPHDILEIRILYFSYIPGETKYEEQHDSL